ELGPVTSNAGLVAVLAQRGYLTGAGRPFDIKAVQWVRHAYQIPAPSPCDNGEISVADAARRLGCSPGVVYYWIENGQLAAPQTPTLSRPRAPAMGAAPPPPPPPPRPPTPARPPPRPPPPPLNITSEIVTPPWHHYPRPPGSPRQSRNITTGGAV